MAFTKIVSPGIDTTGSYTVQELNTIGIMTAGTVQVGSATTVHSTGIDLGSGNITSHNINSTGIITATGLDVNGNGNISGNLSVGGVLTYEDVTNIDSVGIITARSGVHVTGGSVGIGTDNPETKLNIVGSTASVSSTGGTLGIRQKGDTNNDGITLTSSHTNSARFWKDSDGKLHIYNTGTGSNQFVLDNAGNTGIGTDNLTSNLTIAEDHVSTNAELAINYTGSGNRTSAIRFQRGGTNYGYIAGAGFMLTTGAQDDLAIAPVSGKNLLFGIGNSEKLRITSGGNIGIGTETPETPRGNKGLEVAGTTGAEIVATRYDDNLVDGDFIGGFVFKNLDAGGNPNHFAGMYAKANGTAGSMDLHFSCDRERYETDNSDLTIRNSNVGIGTDNPGQLLHLNDASPRILLTETTNNSNCYLDYASPGILELSIDDNNVDDNSKFQVRIDGATASLTLDSSGRLLLGTTVPNSFNGVGGQHNLIVAGSTSDTDITDNSSAAITISNTDGTADNTAGLHFAREDTDTTPHYTGASIVAQFKETQVTGQYPKADLAFLTSTAANHAPSEKMRLMANGDLILGPYDAPGSYTSAALNVPYSIKVAPYGWQNHSEIAAISMGNHSGATGNDDGEIVFKTAKDAHSSTTGLVERLRIDSNGDAIFYGNPSIDATDLYYTNSYSTNGWSTSNWYTVVPHGLTSNSTYLVVLVWDWGSSHGSPYYVATQQLYSTVNGTNGNGSENELTPMVSTHTGGTGARINCRVLAQNGGSPAMQVNMNYTMGSSSYLKVKVWKMTFLNRS